MKVHQVMTAEPRCCRPDDSLNVAARIMWEGDCGFVPVVDAERRVVGVVTDRDALMSVYTRGQRTAELTAADAMSTAVVVCGPDDAMERAAARMREHQIRRLPVVDGERRLLGVISLNDMARKGAPRFGIAETLAAICAPHGHVRAAE